MFEFRVDRSNFKINPGVCDECDGWGTTRETAAVRVNKVTKALGSGCPVCRGIGRVMVAPSAHGAVEHRSQLV